MNTEDDILKRLLSVLPIKVVKDVFDETGAATAVLNQVVRNNANAVVLANVLSNLEWTKTHCHIFSVRQTRWRQVDSRNIPFTIFSDRENDGVRRITGYAEVTYTATTIQPFGRHNIVFRQPFRIHLVGDQMIVFMTILERSLRKYFQGNTEVVHVEKDLEETEIIQRVLGAFGTPIVTDINRGVKDLWNRDIIDSRYAKWKKDRSMATEAMDEGFTFKEQYPADYASMVTRPLDKMIFKYLVDDDEMPDHFTVDPSNGKVSFILYPKTANQITNVILSILQSN
ncbi:hypothetical protein HZ996_03225 [Cryomorphaceae bacterium]|nr:hypothetical protein HZ996_03225 [Cryomorphaceae bacterium]